MGLLDRVRLRLLLSPLPLFEAKSVARVGGCLLTLSVRLAGLAFLDDLDGRLFNCAVLVYLSGSLWSDLTWDDGTGLHGLERRRIFLPPLEGMNDVG